MAAPAGRKSRSAKARKMSRSRPNWDGDGVRSLAGNCRKGPIQLVVAANDNRMDVKAHRCGTVPNLLQEGRDERILGVAQNANSARPRHDVRDQLEALGSRLGAGGG